MPLLASIECVKVTRTDRSSWHWTGAALPLLLIIPILTYGPWEDGYGRPALARTAQAKTSTIVSLTFDDGYASVGAARKILNAHQLRGTFYIPSGFVGQENRLTVDELLAM